MDPRIPQLEERVRVLEEMLNLASMPYSLKEVIRNEVVKGEDSLTDLTQTYTDSAGDTVTAPTAYEGIIVIKWKGREYKVPYLE